MVVVLGPGGETLLLNLLRVLLSLSSRLRESSTALCLSRILALWTSSALDSLHTCSKDLRECLNGSSSTMCSLLEYVYVNWEHPLDAVRHQNQADLQEHSPNPPQSCDRDVQWRSRLVSLSAYS
ncbi:unnamed protein product [Staurois parvus]|uniref:Uncharacterized protein n=1 Tax=Staurois parvus TaxID=386267 RepID=A0ABN9H4F5_9NEOB|nr:unnamed protein product [Staurois parvus]